MGLICNRIIYDHFLSFYLLNLEEIELVTLVENLNIFSHFISSLLLLLSPFPFQPNIPLAN